MAAQKYANQSQSAVSTMDNTKLYSAARLIVARNLTEHVVAATVTWNEETSKLSLRYYVDREPAEDDEDECKYAMTELISEFPFIALASTECIRLDTVDDAQRLDGVVFIRSNGLANRIHSDKGMVLDLHLNIDISINVSPDDDVNDFLGDVARKLFRDAGYDAEDAIGSVRDYYEKFSDPDHCATIRVPVQGDTFFFQEGPSMIARRVHYYIKLKGNPDPRAFLAWNEALKAPGQ